jgi:excisionase family DNA binding protein
VSDRLLDAHEVADLLNVPVSWVRESTRAGAMRCVELGSPFLRADVEAWLKTCKQPGRAVVLRKAHR